MQRRKQRKPTVEELVRTIVDKCGLSESKQTGGVLNRKQLAELVIHVDNQEMRIQQPEVSKDGQLDASTPSSS